MLLVQYNVYTTLNVVPTQPHLYVLLFILKQLKIVQGSFGFRTSYFVWLFTTTIISRGLYDLVLIITLTSYR